MLYIDTSSLLKLLWLEAESEWTRQRIAAEQKVVLSSLAELEANVQLAGACLAGRYSRAKLNAYRRALNAFSEIDPFERADLSAQLFQVALRQQRKVDQPHCGTLDRLHLATMESLGISRLLTHDHRQAQAARALGFEVVTMGFS
ncbi:MAG: type II toxin-antitoxin system VapC family toxin [Chthoniobacterales bacterium]